jgi:endonuclease I
MKHLHALLCLLLSLIALSGQAQPATAAAIFPQMRGEALQQAIRQAYKPQRVLSYGPARELMYRELDNVNDSVTCLYTGYRLYLDPTVERASQYLYRDGQRDGINCEHLWPRSKGARDGNAHSDLHCLAPTRIAANDARSNYPFGEIDDRQTRQWLRQGYSRQGIPPPTNIDEYSEVMTGWFEPREAVKGDIARAMFYFYTMYREEADAADLDFFRQQVKTLCQWHRQDPPDARESARTRAIARHQDGKPNPFVLDPGLAERAFCE